jgi:anti-sigma B factor antagonist
MKYDQIKVGDVTVIRIREKRIDSHRAPDMKTALLGWMIGDGKKFVVNFKDVEQMDSTGLGALLFGIRQADQHGKEISFCEVNSKVRFLIRIARLEEVVPVYETEKEAVDDFQEAIEDV